MPDWLIFRQRCHWHRYGVEEKWHLQMECALLRQSEQSMPDRTANTLVITEGSPVQLCVRSVFRLSWHRYTGDAEGLYLCAGGLLEQETGLNPTEIMTDTAGASELVFGLFWLLGYQFSPRLADAGASVFWRMDHDADYGVLNDIARGQSDPRKIVLQWDEMIRTAGSLKLGKVQASVLVRSLLKSERPSGLTQAIIEVGRINKTLYLLNYIDDEDYRRRILTQLNRGESRHAVARAICHGQKGEIRKRYTDGQEDQLGALGLVTNAVVLWNTIYMQAALDHLRAQGETLNDEDIARLSPLCHGHINMLGHYSFTLAELVTKGHLRPLKEASEAENVA